jgi:FtsP/CotA-like multicopper oxidase with cupredoxin domain
MVFSIYTLLLLVVAAVLPTLGSAGTVAYDLNVTWTYGNPDGFTRSVIGINGAWPPPTLYVTKGDTVILNVHNQLGNQSTSVHVHGMFQNGTTNMDGAAMATQCPIPPGSSMVYNFTVSRRHRSSMANLTVSGQPTRNVLVSFARLRAVPRRMACAIHCPRSG